MYPPSHPSSRPKTSSGSDSNAPSRAQMLYASYMQPSANAIVDAAPPPPPLSPIPPTSERPREVTSTSPANTWPTNGQSSGRLSSPPAPRQDSRAMDPANSILPHSIKFSHKENNPGRASTDDSPPPSLYGSRVPAHRPAGGRPSTSVGSYQQPHSSIGPPPSISMPINRVHSYSGSTSSTQPLPHQHNHHRSATDSFNSRPNVNNASGESRAVYSVASPSQYQSRAPHNTPQIGHPSASTSYNVPSPTAAAAYGAPSQAASSPPPIITQSHYSPPLLQTPSSSYSSPPFSPPPQTPTGMPQYQAVSPPPNVIPNGQRGIIQDTGRAVANSVGSAVGKIAIKAVLGTVGLGGVGDIIGDAIGSVASDALAEVGAEAAASAFSGSADGGGFVEAFTSGAYDPSAFITDGALGGGGVDMSGLVDAFSSLSTNQPSFDSAYQSSADSFAQIMQNYEAQQQAIIQQYTNSGTSPQPDYSSNFYDNLTQSYTNEFLKIAQNQQAQQQTIQDSFSQIYQTSLQNSLQNTQAIIEQSQAQQQAYMDQVQPMLSGQQQQYQQPAIQPPRPPQQQPQHQQPQQHVPAHNSYPRPSHAKPYAPTQHATSPYPYGSAVGHGHQYGRR